MKFLVALVLLTACGTKPDTATPEDSTLNRLRHAGDIAYNLEEPAQAVEQYRAALARARERDDAKAIDDAGFDLATAQLRDGKPRDAMATARELQAELARRGSGDPNFILITATALFRLKDLNAADRLAAELTAGSTPSLADPAWFLRGLIADEKNDQAGLRRAEAALSPSADTGDRAELRARIGRDAAQALHAADLRRDALDYRGMARDLGLAAGFTLDKAASADLYVRAGRSAGAQHDVAQARIWLAKAREIAPDRALREEADRASRDLATH